MQKWQNEYIWINLLGLKYLTLKLMTVKPKSEKQTRCKNRKNRRLKIESERRLCMVSSYREYYRL